MCNISDLEQQTIHIFLQWATRSNNVFLLEAFCTHYGDVIMGAIASQITSLTIVYPTVYSDADQRKHIRSASLAFVRGIHRGPVNSQMASNAVNVSIWWRHHEICCVVTSMNCLNLKRWYQARESHLWVESFSSNSLMLGDEYLSVKCVIVQVMTFRTFDVKILPGPMPPYWQLNAYGIYILS